MPRVVRLLLVALLATPMFWLPQAKACSCIQSDPRDDLHAADGAFTGTYVGREPTDPADPYAEYDYIFETKTVFKGNVGDVVRVRAPANGAGCGLEYAEGATGGLFLQREGEVWRSNLCATEHPDRLEEAARPFPAPDAKGPPRLLVGGSFGEVRVLALDARGKTAGYGYGDGDALHMSLCPGNERSAEVVGSPFANAPVFVDVRRVADLTVSRTTTGPARWDEQPVYPLTARCITPDGDTVVFVQGFDDSGEFTELVLFGRDGTTTIDKGESVSAALGRDAAYVGEGRNIVAVEYDGGGRQPVQSMDGPVTHVALSPNGRLLAGLTGAGAASPRIFVVRAKNGEVLAEEALDGSVPGALGWVNDQRLLLSRRNPAALVLNRGLERKAKVSSWFPLSSVSIGCRLFGTGYGAVARSSICNADDPKIVREFFSPVTNALLKLPRDTEIDAPPKD